MRIDPASDPRTGRTQNVILYLTRYAKLWGKRPALSLHFRHPGFNLGMD